MLGANAVRANELCEKRLCTGTHSHAEVRATAHLGNPIYYFNLARPLSATGDFIYTRTDSHYDDILERITTPVFYPGSYGGSN